MPTTNPVPSQDPSDLLFNAGKLDEVLNGIGTSFTDRLGTARRTVAGMNADFDAQLADAESDLNVYRADAAASAAQALGYLNTIRTTSYGAYATDPATDPLGNPPTVGDEYFNTTANLLKRWNGTTWQASDINTANLAAPSGSSLIGYDTGTVQDVLDGAKSLQDYTALRAYNGRAKRVYITGLLVTAKPAGIAGVFQYDPTDTSSVDNGGTIIVDASGRRWKRDHDGAVNVKWFGAIGGGVGANDTAAFVAANYYLMTRPALPTYQTVESEYHTLLIPPGIYNISGNRVFGSQLPTGSSASAPPRMLQIIGQGASLIWDVQTDSDELFYFDVTITNIKVHGLSIYPTKATISEAGAGVIFRFHAEAGTTNVAAPSKFHMEDVSVWAGRRTAGGSGQQAKSAFLVTGNAMCDQMLIQNCRFNYIKKIWDGKNSQSVNITFSSCSFYGASGSASTKTTYFDFVNMDDNFSLLNCAFTIENGETILKTNSPTSGGFYTGDASYLFNFDKVRIEIVTGTTSWKLCDMNFGKLNLRNMNMALGGGASTGKAIVKLSQVSNLAADNVRFGSVDFYFPVATSAALGGGLNPYGAYFNNCVFNSRSTTVFAWTDGTNNYTIKETLVSTNLYWRSVKFVDCNYRNANGFYTWEFACTKSDLGAAPMQVQKVSLSRGGISFGREFTLPPYQVIKRITLSVVALPNTYNTFRVWIGDRTLSNTFDVDNIRPDLRKTEYVLFEGNATVFTDDQLLQTIEVALLDSGVEFNEISSFVDIEYAPFDGRALGITTTIDAVKLFRSHRTISSGTTAQRPNTDLYVSQPYFDTTLDKPIWWNGSVWKDAAGTTV